MSFWERPGRSNEWYTPGFVFRALDCRFDLDVAAPEDFSRTHVPAGDWYFHGGLDEPWFGFIWMNPPFGGRNGLAPWLDKFFTHGNGVALVPDRTSAPWWQRAAAQADAVLFVRGKIKFERPDGALGKSPSNGTCLFAAGAKGAAALQCAERAGLGLVFHREGSAAC